MSFTVSGVRKSLALEAALVRLVRTLISDILSYSVATKSAHQIVDILTKPFRTPILHILIV